MWDVQRVGGWLRKKEDFIAKQNRKAAECSETQKNIPFQSILVLMVQR